MLASQFGALCLTVFRRDVTDALTVGAHVFAAVGQPHTFRRGWPFGNGESRTPFGRGANRAWREAAAAVRANVLQCVGHAIDAECALIRADARTRGRRRKIAIAAFAVGAQFEGHLQTTVSITHVLARSTPAATRRKSLEIGQPISPARCAASSVWPRCYPTKLCATLRHKASAWSAGRSGCRSRPSRRVRPAAPPRPVQAV